MRKPWFLSILFLLLFFSCEKEKVSLQDYNIRLADHLFSGEKIGTVSFDEKHGAWIAGESKLIHYSGNKTESINIGSAIWDIAVDKNGNVWVGTKDKGLVCYDQSDLKFFNKENSGFPRDLISEVLVDNNNIVWFSSAAHQLGGLIRYDGKTFQIAVDNHGYLWGFGGYTGKRLRFFDGKEWHNTGLDFPDIFAYNMKVDNENNIWLCTNDGIFIIKTK